MRTTKLVLTVASMAAARPSGTGDSNAIIASGSGWPTSVWPVVDMMLVSDSTRSGCSMAMAWAIIPPMDSPATWARAQAWALHFAILYLLNSADAPRIAGMGGRLLAAVLTDEAP